MSLIPTAGYDVVEHLTTVDADTVLLQIRRHFAVPEPQLKEPNRATGTAATSPVATPLRSFLIRASTGALIDSTTAVPSVATDVQSSPRVISLGARPSATITIGTVANEL